MVLAPVSCLYPAEAYRDLDARHRAANQSITAAMARPNASRRGIDQKSSGRAWRPCGKESSLLAHSTICRHAKVSFEICDLTAYGRLAPP
jgi:hypothetical protein